MRKLFWMLVILLLFLFLVVKSNTWETCRVTEMKDGVECKVIKHVMHWDRLAEYLKKLPQEVREGVESLRRDMIKR